MACILHINNLEQIFETAPLALSDIRAERKYR